MPPEMDEEIDQEAQKHGMSYSEYVRQAIRESLGTPFECDDTVLSTDREIAQNDSKGGTA